MAIDSSSLRDISNYQGGSYQPSLDNLSSLVADALQRSGGGEKGVALGGAPVDEALPGAHEVRQAIAGLCGGIQMPGLSCNNLV